MSQRYLRWGQGDSLANLEWCCVHVDESPERESGPVVFWQYRELVLAVIASLKQQKWQNWFQRFGKSDSYEALLVDAGGDLRDWRPSKLSCSRSGTDSERLSWCKQELTLSSLGLLVLFVDYTHRLKGECRKQSKHIIVDIFRKTLLREHGETLELSFLLCGGDWQGKCTRLAAHGRCKHVSEVLSGAGNAFSFQAVQELLSKMFLQRLDCEAVQAWWLELLPRLASSIDASFLEDGVDWSTSVANLTAPRGAKRRLRVDHAALGTEIEQAVREKRFKSARDAARAGTVDADVRQVDESQVHRMKLYHAACLESLRASNIINISSDESVVGTEATMMTAVWSPTSKKALWAIPQVLNWRAKNKRKEPFPVFSPNVVATVEDLSQSVFFRRKSVFSNGRGNFPKRCRNVKGNSLHPTRPCISYASALSCRSKLVEANFGV
eukprot:6457769-Amphidinium_carterae.2